VWKHPSCRVAYVAQHAFHHIEMHLNKTANEYIRWRYETGEDREALAKETMITTPEEEAKVKLPIELFSTDEKGNKRKYMRTIDRLTGNRRADKRKQNEYEVHWLNSSEEDNTYMTEEKLQKLGWTKWLKVIDDKIALRAGMYVRPLTQANVETHLEDVGLEREYGTHNRISALSGGQKVKVVLAAAMWNNPHIVILDEPTNYLDRESLGALAGAIEEFEGGVVMITHNNEFCSALCPETWVLERKTPDVPATLDCKGDAEWMKNVMAEKTEFKPMEEMTDALGNVVKLKKVKGKMSRQEKKKALKKRAAKIAAGEELDSDDEALDDM